MKDSVERFLEVWIHTGFVCMVVAAFFLILGRVANMVGLYSPLSVLEVIALIGTFGLGGYVLALFTVCYEEEINAET